MTCHPACLVRIAPSKFVVSPAHHSSRNHRLNPDVDFREWFLIICGTCAKSQETMLRVPRAVEMKASGVGMQVWKVDESPTRKPFVGVQWSGRESNLS